MTGARGFLGAEISRALPHVRGIGRGGWPDNPHMHGWVVADLSNGLAPEALAGADVVVHAAAETSGGYPEHQRNTIDATRHLLHAMHAADVRRLVLVSSLSVIRPPRTAWERQDERTPRPGDPRLFGPYTWGKCLQEELAEREAAALGIAIRIIRPGALVDWHEPALPGLMGRRLFGRWHMGLGRPGLPIAVCDVERCAEAIAWCATHFEKAPPIVNLLDPAIATRGDFVARLRAGGWTGRMLWVPISVVALGLTAARAASSLSRGRRPGGLAVWSILRPRRYDTRLAAEMLESVREDARRCPCHRDGREPGERSACEPIVGAGNRRDGPVVLMGIHLDWRYGLLTAALLSAIYWMSSVPDLGTESDALVLLASNLSHAPLFAVLTFCWLKTLSGALEISGPVYGFASLASGAFAVLDEWHQSSVPGRHASVGDLLLDIAGIGAMLVIVRLTRLRAGDARRSEPRTS